MRSLLRRFLLWLRDPDLRQCDLCSTEYTLDSSAPVPFLCFDCRVAFRDALFRPDKLSERTKARKDDILIPRDLL